MPPDLHARREVVEIHIALVGVDEDLIQAGFGLTELLQLAVQVDALPHFGIGAPGRLGRLAFRGDRLHFLHALLEHLGSGRIPESEASSLEDPIFPSLAHFEVPRRALVFQDNAVEAGERFRRDRDETDRNYDDSEAEENPEIELKFHFLTIFPKRPAMIRTFSRK